MKRLILVLALLVCFSWISTASVEVTLLEPTQYVRTKGKPNAYENTFPGVIGEAILIVTNGDGDGKKRISRAVIWVNGEEVLGTSDFNQKLGELTVQIGIQQDSTIRVELRSKPGSYLTVEVNRAMEVDAGKSIGPGSFAEDDELP